jgi:hypothetical protein
MKCCNICRQTNETLPSPARGRRCPEGADEGVQFAQFLIGQNASFIRQGFQNIATCRFGSELFALRSLTNNPHPPLRGTFSREQEKGKLRSQKWSNLFEIETQ